MNINTITSSSVIMNNNINNNINNINNNNNNTNDNDNAESSSDGWYSSEAASADSRGRTDSQGQADFKRNLASSSSSGGSSNFRSVKSSQVAVKSVEDLQRDYFWDSVDIHFDPSMFAFQLMVQVFPYPFAIFGWINPIAQGK